MRRADLPKTSLSGLKLAVFGLGDSSYSRFNVASKLLEARLVQLGATKVIARGDGDDQHRMGLYGGLAPWLESLTSELNTLYPLPSGVTIDDSSDIRPEPRYRIQLGHPSDNPNNGSTSQASEPTGLSPSSYRELTPYPSKVVQNNRITDPSWTQDVRHIALEASGLSWNPGDVVYIQPLNFPEDVNKMLKLLGKTGDEVIQAIERIDSEAPVLRAPRPGETLRSYISSEIDISGIPRRYFFELLAHFATTQVQADKLKELSSPAGQEALHEYVRRAKRSFLDVFADFDSARPTLDYLFDLMPKLQPRAFSISSSYSSCPSALTISMVVVQYKSATNRLRRGVCSTWLSQISPSNSQQTSIGSPFPQSNYSASSHVDKYLSPSSIPIWIKPGTMTLPSDSQSTPIVMVGPGTGCAIFRAFVEQRMHFIAEQASKSSTEPVKLAPAFFYFGCRHESKDFLYRDLWIDAIKCGALSQLSIAFSQDKVAKRMTLRRNGSEAEIAEIKYDLPDNLSRAYVQHCIKQDARPLWNLISEHNASIFVCGNANKMPNDVRNAFIEVAMSSGMSDVESETYIRNLEAKRRYSVESWS